MKKYAFKEKNKKSRRLRTKKSHLANGGGFKVKLKR